MSPARAGVVAPSRHPGPDFSKGMQVMDLRIDPEFKGLIPPLTNEEYRQLEENILADGCRDPLVTWQGVILDGHTRYEICRRHNLEFQTVPKLTIETREQAKVWIILNQLGRRNLEPFQRIELARQLKPSIAAKAKESQKRKPKSVLTISSKQKAIDTRKQIARAAGVSGDTLRKAEKIIETGTEEQKTALRTGKTADGSKTSINREYKKIAEPTPFEAAVKIDEAELTGDSNNLQQLKYFWKRSSRSDKKRFRQWIGVEPCK